MELQNEIQKMFSDVAIMAEKETAAATPNEVRGQRRIVKTVVRKKGVLHSRKDTAFVRSLIKNPDRSDLSASEFSEFYMLHRRLRIDGHISDFSGMSLSDLRVAAIQMELATAIRIEEYYRGQ